MPRFFKWQCLQSSTWALTPTNVLQENAALKKRWNNFILLRHLLKATNISNMSSPHDRRCSCTGWVNTFHLLHDPPSKVCNAPTGISHWYLDHRLLTRRVWWHLPNDRQETALQQKTRTPTLPTRRHHCIITHHTSKYHWSQRNTKFQLFCTEQQDWGNSVHDWTYDTSKANFYYLTMTSQLGYWAN